MNKVTEKKVAKQISPGSLFGNGMLLTSDQIHERCRNYSCNINPSLKKVEKNVHIKNLLINNL